MPAPSHPAILRRASPGVQLLERRLQLLLLSLVTLRLGLVKPPVLQYYLHQPYNLSENAKAILSRRAAGGMKFLVGY
jgi:hypothetical protein